MKIDPDAPAFPYTAEEAQLAPVGEGVMMGPVRPVQYYGLSAIAHAAIHLRVPMSGINWLDDMIREARRMGAAEKAMQGLLVRYGMSEAYAKLSANAVNAADLLIAELNKDQK